MNPKIVIAGAGLVGPSLAIMLHRLGHSVALYEKNPDLQGPFGKEGRSVNLVITSRGINALQKIGLWKKILPLAVPVLGRMIHGKNGKLSYSPYGQGERECNYSISRSRLNRFLQEEAKACKIDLLFEHRVERVDLASKTISFAGGGGPLAFELLFGADGGGSAIRQSMKEQLPQCLDNSKFFHVEYKEMLMPEKPGGGYAMEKNALHLWPRGEEMLMGLPNRDGSFTMTLFMPKQRFLELGDRASVGRYFQQQFPDAISLMPHYLDEYMANPQGVFGTVRFCPWTYGGHTCLLGDAAHGIVPFFGQGLNLGLEDCSTLHSLWQQHRHWPDVLCAFESIQRPNGDAIASMAIENYFEMAQKTGDDEFLLRKEIEHKIEGAFPHLYRSRYGMIAYTLIPYHLIYQAGKIQGEILDLILQRTKRACDLDLAWAKELIEENLVPFLQREQIDLKRFEGH